MRLEHDVLALKEDHSFCKFFGPPPSFLPFTGFDGFYLGDFSSLPEVVATVASFHARGVFIIPVWPQRGPKIGKVYGRSSKPLHWVDFVLKHSVLQIDLPRVGFFTTTFKIFFLGTGCGDLF